MRTTSKISRLHCANVNSESVEWSSELFEGRITGTAVEDNQVYSRSIGGRSPGSSSLRAFDISNGTLLWEHDEFSSQVSHPVVSDIGIHICTTGSPGEIITLSKDTGEILWKFTKPANFTRTVVSKNRIYVGCADCFLYAIDAQDGHEQWRYNVNDKIRVPLVIANNCIYVSDENGRLHEVEHRSVS